MAFLAPIAGILGAGVSAVGAVAGGEAASENASYQAQVAANNAIIATQNANYATEAGQTKAANESLKSAATGGEIKTALAANNIDVNSGSAAAVEKSQREEGELNAETTLNNAELQAYGYRSQATNYTAESGLLTSEAAQAPIGADIGAAGSLLSNASGIGFKWQNFGSSPTP
jgi:hypothetical protein